MYKLDKNSKRFNFNITLKCTKKSISLLFIMSFNSHKSKSYNSPCDNYNLSFISQTQITLIKGIFQHKYVKSQELFKSAIDMHS